LPPPRDRVGMRRATAVGVAALLVASLALAPGVAAADTRVGGTVVVESGERVGDVTAIGGTVVVNGTVAGDLEAYGSEVRITEGGSVEGRLRAYGGEVTVAGAVGENAVAYGSTVELAPSGRIAGSFGGAGGDVTVAGTVGGDVTAVAATVRFARTAAVDGNVYYQGTLADEGADIDGVVRRVSDLGLVPSLAGPLSAALGLYFLVVDLLVGGALLYAFPRAADAATRRVRAEPLATVAGGLAAVLGVGVAALLLAISLVGLPVALALLALAAVLGWLATIYGRYVVGALALSRAGVDGPHRYRALLAGVVGVALLGLVPYLGPAVRVAVFLFGAGLVVLGGRTAVDRLSASPPARGRL